MPTFIVTEDNKFLVTNAGNFLILEEIFFAEVRKRYTVLSRTTEFEVSPRLTELTLLARTIEFETLPRKINFETQARIKDFKILPRKTKFEVLPRTIEFKGK